MFAVLLMLLFCCPLYAETPAVSFLKQADAAYAKRLDFTEAQSALTAYRQAISVDAVNVEAHWKASRAAWWLGDQTEKRADKSAYFQQAMDLAKAGIALDPNSVESHFWLGASMGSLGETKGVMKSLSLVKPIRQEMAEVNRIDDRFNGGSGYRVLGIVDYQVPGIVGGNKKRALIELNTALAIDAQNPFTRYYLADYFKAVGDKEKMKAEWTALKTLNVQEDLVPEYQGLLKKGKKTFGE